MTDTSRHDAWQAGDSYELYMGRWSRRIAPGFLDWLDPDSRLDWLEVGCGTGALSAAILAKCNPKSLISIDPSEGFLAKARASVTDARVAFQLGDAQALTVPSGSRDMIVSALVLNFVPDRAKALAEMKRAGRSGATVAFYVWDYPGGGVEFMRAFWTAATALDPSAVELTEDRRFPFCTAGWADRPGPQRRPGFGRLQQDRDAGGVQGFRRLLAPLHARRRAGAGLLHEPRSAGAASD